MEEAAAEVGKTWPSSSQGGSLACNVEVEVCGVWKATGSVYGRQCCPPCGSKRRTPSSDRGRGSGEGEQKAHHNWGWTDSLLILHELEIPARSVQRDRAGVIAKLLPRTRRIDQLSSCDLLSLITSRLFHCLGRGISNEGSHSLFSQQQIPCFAPPPASTVKMVFASIKASCATVRITVKTTAMKKAAKALKVGTEVYPLLQY